MFSRLVIALCSSYCILSGGQLLNVLRKKLMITFLRFLYEVDDSWPFLEANFLSLTHPKTLRIYFHLDPFNSDRSSAV